MIFNWAAAGATVPAKVPAVSMTARPAFARNCIIEKPFV
jgi:hypothetical protein